jgi:speckle-type POZ protein
MSGAIQAKVFVELAPPREGWKSIRFNLREFTDLPTTKKRYVITPEFSYNGCKWALMIYPGGIYQAADGYCSIFLECTCFDLGTIGTFEVTLLDKFGNVKKVRKWESKNKHWGWNNFIKHSDVLNESQNMLDDDGTLAIVLSVKDEPTTPFVPKNPLVNMIQRIFLDEDTADVVFKVSNAEVKEDGSERASSHVAFHAHRSILHGCAPTLAALFHTHSSKEIATMTISDVKPDIFRHLLWYVYGGSVAEEDLKTHAKDIIDAADKYSIVGLKLEAEAVYVESTTITIDNVMDNLLYADAKNCALLKETVIDFIADNGKEVISKISFDDVLGLLMKDLLVATTRSKEEDKNWHKPVAVDDFDIMRVSELRRKLDEKGLDVDGSREAMIAALKSTTELSGDD